MCTYIVSAEPSRPDTQLITADGAQEAEVTDRGGYVEVRVGSDRYHLPVSK